MAQLYEDTPVCASVSYFLDFKTSINFIKSLKEKLFCKWTCQFMHMFIFHKSVFFWGFVTYWLLVEFLIYMWSYFF